MAATKTPGMKRSRVPFAAKLRPDMKHKIVTDSKGRGQMLLPTPTLLAREIAAVPEGSLITMPALRTRLARKFGADLACPLMSGIFLNLIAGAAEEQIAAGEPPVAPYWRVVLEDGSLSPKTPNGPDTHAEHLRREGHAIEARGDKLKVSDYQRSLVS
jgi:hypothetical protein